MISASTARRIRKNMVMTSSPFCKLHKSDVKGAYYSKEFFFLQITKNIKKNSCMIIFEHMWQLPRCGAMGWPRLVGSWKLQVAFAKEPYQRDYILQKRPVILSSLLNATAEVWCYGVATISRLREITGLFCKI